MQQFRFWQVDAFTQEPYMGNPAAVVFNGDALSAEQMQTIARQFNLSETVFLCEPSTDPAADYRARIFTPRQELPFAGHPTIAACFTHVSTRSDVGNGAVVRQECGAGTIELSVTDEDGLLSTMTMAESRATATSLTQEDLVRMLGCDPGEVADEPAELCSAGLPWLIARVKTLDGLQRATPDQGLVERTCHAHGAVGLTTYSEGAVLDGCELHVRSFAPGEGIPEDPVCGSGNGAVAIHVARHLYKDRPSFAYRAEQGLEVHRRGILHLFVDRAAADGAPAVRLGGHAARVMEGQLSI